MSDDRSRTSTPARDAGQRRQALARANWIRAARAELKRKIRRGEAAIARLISDPPDFLATMKVQELLLAVPRCGPVKANKLLSACRVSPAKTLAGLTPRQREELAQTVQGWQS